MKIKVDNKPLRELPEQHWEVEIGDSNHSNTWCMHGTEFQVMKSARVLCKMESSSSYSREIIDMYKVDHHELEI